ncbi:Aaa Atpase P97VCP ND1 in complex WITH P47 C [Dactylonectria macrodidyma]|uniref:Aaa Atpase P97VCP ND1 in complex WITH P47 C n=1 Tax=Dactylonectria macrodidyma TaxID=307937 RepID=A0A9P9FRW9_9HYPO|nr:Aaa Atpase P97VCP ND1 in complex WITH P47 C [Dactylonectria macrodidyma]
MSGVANKPESNVLTPVLRLRPDPSKLIVAELADAMDDDSSVVRISTKSMEQLGLALGDTVRVRGRFRKDTVLIVGTDDLDDGHARIHRASRQNLGVLLGDTVTLQPFADIKTVNRLAVSPIADTVQGVTGSLFDIFLAPYFREAYRPVHKGDTFIVKNSNGLVEFKITACEPVYGIVAQDTVILCGGSLSRDEADGPRIGYYDIGGYGKEVAMLQEMAGLPLTQPELFTSLGIQPARGALLHGPPGNGKTRLVEALANETGAFLFLVDSSLKPGELRSVAFREAKENRPAIVLIENIDLLAPNRARSIGQGITASESTSLSELLGIFDQLNREQQGQVFVIGTTTCLNDVDMSLRQSGRFDSDIKIGLPDTPARLDILSIHLNRTHLAKDVNLEELAAQTKGFSGAALVALCREAAMQQVRLNLDGIDLQEGQVDPNSMAPLRIEMVDFLSCIPSCRRRGS